MAQLLDRRNPARDAPVHLGRRTARRGVGALCMRGVGHPVTLLLPWVFGVGWPILA